MQGGTAPARSAVADRMTIGDTVLRDVPLIVYPDTQPPWNELPAGRRGGAGSAGRGGVADGRVDHQPHLSDWRREQRGRRPARESRLRSSEPHRAARFGARPLDFVLDTGNQGGTQLWSRFARDFPGSSATRVGRAPRPLHQIGGAKPQDIVVLPEAHLAIGTFDAVLRPAEVFGQSVGDDVHHGNLGMSVLGQAKAVTIDLRAMLLTLR